MKKPVIKQVAPETLTIPELRVTSYMPDEIKELFKSTIAESGIQQPPLVQETEGQLIVLDGRNRVEEAIAQGLKTITVVITTGTFQDAKLRNLTLTRTQGKPSPVEMMRVVASLVEDDKMGSDEISAKTGLSRDYIERLWKISEAIPEVVDAVQDESIGVTAANLIANIEDEDTQWRVLHQQMEFKWTAAELKEHIAKTVAFQEEAPEPLGFAQPTQPVLQSCYLCERGFPAGQLRAVWLCPDDVGGLAGVKLQLKQGHNVPE